MGAATSALDAPVTSPFTHDPVMVRELTELFGPVPAGLVVDATLGGGGHSHALLASREDITVLGLDRDPLAIAAATERLAPFAERVALRNCRFDRLSHEVAELGEAAISGFLFDLGVSSPQIDRPERGFSYRQDGPLDMRMGTDADRSAADIINESTQQELATMLRDLGDERHARRIAAAIVAARPLHTTNELADVVREATPARDRRRGDPAKRTFQALRIAVNDELEVLKPALEQASSLLRPGGRGAVLAYHSGEDRIVKDHFRTLAGVDHDPRVPRLVEPTVRLLWRRGQKPTDDEIERNPRAASARCRAIEAVAA